LHGSSSLLKFVLYTDGVSPARRLVPQIIIPAQQVVHRKSSTAFFIKLIADAGIFGVAAGIVAVKVRRVRVKLLVTITNNSILLGGCKGGGAGRGFIVKG